MVKNYYALFICYFFIKWRGYVVYSVNYNIDTEGKKLLNIHGFDGYWHGSHYAMGEL